MSVQQYKYQTFSEQDKTKNTIQIETLAKF